MNITTTTKHTITFHVAYHEHDEGGMDTSSFGKPCNSLAEAVHILEVARIQSPGHDWVIVGEVETKVS